MACVTTIKQSENSYRKEKMRGLDVSPRKRNGKGSVKRYVLKIGLYVPKNEK